MLDVGFPRARNHREQGECAEGEPLHAASPSSAAIALGTATVNVVPSGEVATASDPPRARTIVEGGTAPDRCHWRILASRTSRRSGEEVRVDPRSVVGHREVHGIRRPRTRFDRRLQGEAVRRRHGDRVSAVGDRVVGERSDQLQQRREVGVDSKAGVAHRARGPGIISHTPAHTSAES